MINLNAQANSMISAQLSDARMERMVLVSRLDQFGDEARNEGICDLIDKCEQKIDSLQIQLAICEEIGKMTKKAA